MDLNLDIIIVITYLILTLAVGLYFSRGVKNIQEYAIGNRTFSTTVLVMTITATIISGGFIVLGAGEAYRVGMVDSLSALGMGVCALLNAYLIGPRMGRFMGQISVGGIMNQLYGPFGRVITGFSAFIVCLGFVAGQVKVMGSFFNHFMGVDAFSAVIISSIIIVIYSAFGGIRAVTFTDVLQFGTLMVSIPLIYSVLINLVGGYPGIVAKVQPHHLTLASDDISIMNYVTIFFFFALPVPAAPITQRMLMARNIKQITDSFKYSAGLISLLAIIAGIIGITAYAIDPNLDPSKAFLIMIDTYLPTGAKGVAIIGMIAIAMSTADSFINAGSVGLTHDVIKVLYGDKMSDKGELLLSKIVTIIVGVVAVFIALKFTSLLELGLFMQSFYGPLVGIPLMLGVLGFSSSVRVLMLALATSTSVIITWLCFDLEAKLGFGLHIPAMLVNAITLIGGHKLLGEKGGWVNSGNSFASFSKLRKAYHKIRTSLQTSV